MEYQKALKTEEVAEGEMRSVELGGKIVTIVHSGKDFFAFDDTCSHKQCSLSGGTLEGVEVICPCHGGKFNVKTGEAAALPAVAPIKTYPVMVEDNTIKICLT
jgi:3-phenylpropionate/trans-cinnamate dioxygenase ferredoxin subunit